MEAKEIMDMVDRQYYRYCRDNIGPNETNVVIPEELRSKQARAIINVLATIIVGMDDRIQRLEKTIRSIKL